ncbi:uncharacterized protein LOC143773335 [Ranitomeya variabilis]|uniref:uncharacterized protein LOC143773335 n=1 Tax=Ranitomeya variabilis TaxID=490064 RepID=UPI004056A2B5
MGCPDEKGKKSAQDIMFAGLGQRKRRSFPAIPTIKELVKKEWEKQHTRGFLPSSAKRRYPFSDEELNSWQKIPKVDAAVASTSKQSVLPVEDSGTLTDPLDRKAEALLKRSWEANTGAFRPAISSTCTARSLLVWTEQLEEQIRSGASRNTILSKIPLMKDAVAFLADASVDSLRLTARSAGLVNTARRALWLKNWKGDAQAKAKLCAIPCQGELSGGAPSPGTNLLNKGSAGKQRIQNKEVLCFPDPITKNVINTVNYEVGGRLKYFFDKWKLITSSPWILDIIGNGLRLEFHRIPWDSFIVTSPRGQQQQEALESEILSLLYKKVLIEVPRDQEGRGFYSPLFLINKPDGSFRTIINLKKLNSFLRNHTFKMESISSTIKLLFPRCVMAGIDLKDAYYHLPIHAEHQQYLRVAVILKGQVRHFQYVAMPFGLSMAPRIFTKVMLEVMAHLRQRDTLIIPYLDDFLVIGNSVAQCKLRLSNTISSLQELGWIINFEKSRLNPDTTQMFLGIQLDSIQGADVRVFSDNSTTVAYVNRQGGTRSGSLMTIAGEIFQFAETHLTSLTALHIRGVENTKADYLSRNRLRQGEWSLNRTVFRLITRAWGVPQIDLFATRGNRQVERFASLNSMDHPDMLDSLHHPWDFRLAYAFPPISQPTSFVQSTKKSIEKPQQSGLFNLPPSYKWSKASAIKYKEVLNRPPIQAMLHHFNYEYKPNQGVNQATKVLNDIFYTIARLSDLKKKKKRVNRKMPKEKQTNGWFAECKTVQKTLRTALNKKHRDPSHPCLRDAYIIQKATILRKKKQLHRHQI